MSTPCALRVVIVDDHPAIRRDVERLIAPMEQFTVVGSCESIEEALEVICATSPDILLLDINLGNGSGFELLEQVPDQNFKIIFLTAYQEYAIRAIKAGAIDYLLKPINEIEFRSALTNVLKSTSNLVAQPADNKKKPKEMSRIFVSTQQHLEVVEIKDIIFCHSDSGYTTFHLMGNRKIVACKYLKEYDDQLPTERFIRTHKSFVVNMKFVERYHKEGYLLLNNGIKIPIALRRREIVRKSLLGILS